MDDLKYSKYLLNELPLEIRSSGWGRDFQSGQMTIS